MNDPKTEYLIGEWEAAVVRAEDAALLLKAAEEQLELAKVKKEAAETALRNAEFALGAYMVPANATPVSTFNVWVRGGEEYDYDRLLCVTLDRPDAEKPHYIRWWTPEENKVDGPG